MHMVVNTSPLHVYKKYRITSLLCIFETIIRKLLKDIKMFVLLEIDARLKQRLSGGGEASANLGVRPGNTWGNHCDPEGDSQTIDTYHCRNYFDNCFTNRYFC